MGAEAKVLVEGPKLCILAGGDEVKKMLQRTDTDLHRFTQKQGSKR